MIIESDLNNCPEPVRRYLTKAGVIDSKRKTYAQIFHDGEFRMKPNQRWFPIRGDYHFKPMDPSFEWKAIIQILPLISISVKDEYKDGVGRSVVKFGSFFKIADQAGPQVSDSSLGRLLIELILIPTALVSSEHLHWEAIDSTHARVVLTNCNFEATAVFEFDANGLPAKTSIERFGIFDGVVQKKTFICTLSDYEVFDGLLIPTEIIGSWNLSTGLFNWLHFKIQAVQFA